MRIFHFFNSEAESVYHNNRRYIIPFFLAEIGHPEITQMVNSGIRKSDNSGKQFKVQLEDS